MGLNSEFKTAFTCTDPKFVGLSFSFADDSTSNAVDDGNTLERDDTALILGSTDGNALDLEERRLGII